MAPSGLSVEVERGAQPVRWRLAGRIDEKVDLDLLPAQVEGTSVVIDLAGVDFINSAGVRQWLALTRGLQARGIRVLLERCPEIMVRQLNLIQMLRDSVRVESAFVPYECESCGRDSARLMARSELEMAAVSRSFPGERCGHCGAQQAAAQDPDFYLSFLQVGRR